MAFEEPDVIEKLESLIGRILPRPAVTLLRSQEIASFEVPSPNRLPNRRLRRFTRLRMLISTIENAEIPGFVMDQSW